MFRKCPEHGWLATSEYTVADDGEPVCPICYADESNCGREGCALHDFTHDAPNGVLKRAQAEPREKFTSAMVNEQENAESKSIEFESDDTDIGPLFGDE